MLDIVRNGSLYGQSARFDVTRGLTHDELRKRAPSIFARTAHESRSERFAVIPTVDVLDALAKEGFHAVGAKQSLSRVPGKADFTKHLIRLRRFDGEDRYSVGDTVCEMLLKNANDGTCRYELMAGLFRIACMNSLVTPVGELESVKVGHSGKVADKVVEGTYRVLGTAQEALAAPQDWSKIMLRREEGEILARAVHTLRFADADGKVTTPVKPEQLLVPRRAEDRSGDLWTAFNVVQENTIKGGVQAVGRDANDRPRRMRTRAVTGIDQDIKLNRAMFQLAAEMARLRGAAA